MSVSTSASYFDRRIFRNEYENEENVRDHEDSNISLESESESESDEGNNAENNHNLSREDHFQSHGTIHSINQWSFSKSLNSSKSLATKKTYSPTISPIPSLSKIKSQESFSIYTDESQRKKNTMSSDDVSLDINSQEQNSIKSTIKSKFSFLWFLFALVIAAIILVGICLIIGSTFFKHAEYNKIESIEYIATKINTKYCSKYDSCYWSCCTLFKSREQQIVPLKNESYCPETSSSLSEIIAQNDNSSYCERTVQPTKQTTNIIGKKCGFHMNNISRLNVIQCCQGGPCQEEKNYWKIKCVYTLSGNMGKTFVNISLDHLFFGKKSAINSFVCSTGANTINNKTNTFISMYFPIKGHEFKVAPSKNFSNCRFESPTPTCIYSTDKIFDENEIYSMNSRIYYDNYLESLKNYLVGGILLVVFGLMSPIIIMIIIMIKYKCIHEYIFCGSVYKVVLSSQKKLSSQEN